MKSRIPNESSPYNIAIDQTTTTIHKRARYFRNLIVAVVVLTAGSLVAAAARWTPRPLTGILLLIPACGLFFIMDGRLVDQWQTSLIDNWLTKEIDFVAFCKAVNAIPMLPNSTLQSMLRTLPRAPDLITEQRISASTRAGVAAAMEEIQSSWAEKLTLKVAAAAIITLSVEIAVALRMPQPLFGVLAILFLPLLRGFLQRNRFRTFNERIAVARSRLDFCDEQYRLLLARLHEDAGLK